MPEPTSVVPLADGSLLVADRSGLIVRVSGSDVVTVADLSPSVLHWGQRGLLGLAVHPLFPAVPEAYVLYTADGAVDDPLPRPGANDECSDPCVASGVLSRLDWDGERFAETSILRGWCQIFFSHSPDDVVVLDDGSVLASAGDAAITGFDDPSCPEPAGQGGSMRAQDVFLPGDPVDYLGSVIRVDRDGTPLPVDGATRPDTDARIVAAGLRNPFRMTLDRSTGRVFVVDAGDNTLESIDEIDLNSVRNHGWPCFEGAAPGSGTNTAWCTQLAYDTTAAALFTYANEQRGVSADDGDRCAPGEQGTTISAITTIPSVVVGGRDADGRVIVFGDFGRRCLWYVAVPDPGQTTPPVAQLLASDVPGPIDLEVGPDGAIYYVAFETAEIRRLRTNSDTSSAPG